MVKKRSSQNLRIPHGPRSYRFSVPDGTLQILCPDRQRIITELYTHRCCWGGALRTVRLRTLSYGVYSLLLFAAPDVLALQSAADMLE